MVNGLTDMESNQKQEPVNVTHEKMDIEVNILLERLFTGDSVYVISENIPGMVALYGYRDNRKNWYRNEITWPEINGIKAWDSKRLVKQIGDDTRAGKGKRDKGLIEKGFIVLLEEGDMVKYAYYYHDEFNQRKNLKKTSYYVFQNGYLVRTTWHKYKSIAQ